MTFKLIFTSFLFVCLACTTTKSTMSADPHSFSNPDEVRLKHLTWKAQIDFKQRTIEAVATWKIENVSGANRLVLDSKGLSINKILDQDSNPLDFKTGPSDSVLGEPLEINILNETRTIAVHYRTSPQAEALQWLSPQQTASKRFPFMFTQSQAILARTWIPCQDSPGVRFTYEAEVTVPAELMVLMSASNPEKKNDSGVYKFSMRQPIPSYLLALAAGDIEFRKISDRSGIYAEPPLVDPSAWEFADMEKMISAAEQLYGTYQWGRYDVLVLPPSFPFGGMENPRLTFATPTILAGDRSLTSLIAHELAHSWSGNLVTNATWNDFWLNEGFTVYFETRIMEKLYGKDYAEMLASLNLQDLKDEIKNLVAEGKSRDTKLKLDLAGRNPDEGVTDIAYNKGYFFLRSLEEKFGRDKFDNFVKIYFSENAFKAMDTEMFIPFLQNYYLSDHKITISDTLLNAWIYSEGLPADCPLPLSVRFEKVDTVISHWKKSGSPDPSLTAGWSTHEWLHFLKNLPDTLNQQQMQTLDEFGKFTASGNAEIITAWGILAIKNKYVKAYPAIESFLLNSGRRKFLMPLYSEFVKTKENKAFAGEIYRKARPNYHFVATSSIDKLFEYNQ